MLLNSAQPSYPRTSEEFWPGPRSSTPRFTCWGRQEFFPEASCGGPYTPGAPRKSQKTNTVSRFRLACGHLVTPAWPWKKQGLIHAICHWLLALPGGHLPVVGLCSQPLPPDNGGLVPFPHPSLVPDSHMGPAVMDTLLPVLTPAVQTGCWDAVCRGHPHGLLWAV